MRGFFKIFLNEGGATGGSISSFVVFCEEGAGGFMMYGSVLWCVKGDFRQHKRPRTAYSVGLFHTVTGRCVGPLARALA